MLLRVYVDSPEDFKLWVRGQQQQANEDEKEAAGRRVFERTACLNCHGINGTNGTGRFGPDLTHLMSRRTIASGAAENNSQDLRLWIQNPEFHQAGISHAGNEVERRRTGCAGALSRNPAIEKESGISNVVGCHSHAKPQKPGGRPWVATLHEWVTTVDHKRLERSVYPLRPLFFLLSVVSKQPSCASS